MQSQIHRHGDREEGQPCLQLDLAAHGIKQCATDRQSRERQHDAAQKNVGQADGTVLPGPQPSEPAPRGIAVRESQSEGLIHFMRPWSPIRALTKGNPVARWADYTGVCLGGARSGRHGPPDRSLELPPERSSRGQIDTEGVRDFLVEITLPEALQDFAFAGRCPASLICESPLRATLATIGARPLLTSRRVVDQCSAGRLLEQTTGTSRGGCAWRGAASAIYLTPC